MNSPQYFPVVSLFCGPGGMDLGFQQAGFTTILALDASSVAIETFNTNHTGQVAKLCNLSKLTGEELIKMVHAVSPDIAPRGLIGGPPCQAFSRGNTNKKRHDPRARLGLAFARLAAALNAEFGLDFIVFENVAGLAGKSHHNRFEKIKRELRRAGFNLFVQTLDACDYGVPQHRRRLLIIGINRDKFPWLQFKFPGGSASHQNVREAIGNLPEPVFFKRELSPEDIPFHANHWTMNPRSPKFRGEIQGSGRSFKKLAWDKPSFTVAYGNREIHIHPNGKRRLSILEAMLLQGFPETYRICGSLSDQITQISDAVPPPLARVLGISINQSIYEPIARLRRSLLEWFESNHRSFPWRNVKDSYQILIAEKLLQQTAATSNVVWAFNEIVERYPDWKALANAQEAELKDIVAHLGFEYRAGELGALARTICEHHSGQVPRDMKKLLSLPGIGDYCARAILSFAFDMPVAIVDTNVARFLIRYFALPLRVTQNPARDRKMHMVADGIVPPSRSRDFNLAVLDLCASHCKSGHPECHDCPVHTSCAFTRVHEDKAITMAAVTR